MQLCDEDKHLNNGDEHKRLAKDESSWPIAFSLRSEEKQVGRWTTLSWSIEDIALYQQAPVSIAAEESDDTVGSTTYYERTLFLYRDERTDYRFNLSSQDPHLFIVCEVTDEQFTPLLITAAQSVASSYMDGDYQVLHIQMPLPVQAWMEAFIGRNGELIEFKKKRCKDRKGRSSGQ
ncbi:DUF3305 domain-containing protein [Moritella sp. F3]|uniref:DUF3305 domain-containing protein n=1 Tax=Moritella sp. F3 TaxID=2718882 RepID=UPI0018E1A889|nr:DUF3305 domain-containing protein [Moritella sp. F3]GIC76455.1 hypothetical protein FMO001_11820 [Moritella sp. F1]GIC80876.1 hypothetical protein FMO003_11570 [Moritella sp. F3]